MPLSFQQHTANGSTTVFSASQIDGYLSVNDIYVYVNDVQKTAGVHYSLQTSPSLQITFLPGNTPAFKDEVRIQRITPNTVSGRAVDFADGSVLNASDLDKSALQLLYITQEAEDTGSGALGKQFDQFSWNAEGLPITSAATGGGSDSLTTKGYVDNLALYGGGAVNPQAWTFSGDNVLDTFTLSPVANATNPAMFIVEVGGTILRPTTDYTIPTASQIVFSSPPALGTNNITVRNFGVSRNLNESVSTAMIQNGAVTSAKLGASLAVTTALTVGGQTVGRKGPATNIVLGDTAGNALSTGTGNVFVGSAAGSSNDGLDNVLIGRLANASSSTNYAVAIGTAAKGATHSVAVGNAALAAGQSTSNNTAVGYLALTANSSNGGNVAVGTAAGDSITSGSDNVLIGLSADVQGATNINSIAIGANAVGAGSNTTVIGNSSTTNTIIPAGNLTVSTGNLTVSTGNLTVSTGNLAVTGQATFGSVGQSLIRKQYGDVSATGAFVGNFSIPSWTQRITITWMGVSTNGTEPLFIWLGQGSYPTPAVGYVSRLRRDGVAYYSETTGFRVTGPLTATNNYSGTAVIERVDTAGTVWVCSGTSFDMSANTLDTFVGRFSNGSTMVDRVQIFPASGQLFDGTGRIAISWE